MDRGKLVETTAGELGDPSTEPADTGPHSDNETRKP